MVDATPKSAALRPIEHRVERVCSICGQIDDHPHIIGLLPNGEVVDAHHDCAAAQPGMHPDVAQSAQAIVTEHGGKTGPDLIEALVKKTRAAEKANLAAAKAAQPAEGA